VVTDIAVFEQKSFAIEAVHASGSCAVRPYC
jgi:hypothetical protein